MARHHPYGPHLVVLPPLDHSFSYFPFLTRKKATTLIGLLALVFYISSLNGEYALDDGIIIHQNDHVLKGFRGIKDILLRDAYESFYRRMCATDQLAGGRYRPLSAVSFAIEQEFIGKYRTGLYMKVEDSNKNGILDQGAVSYVTPCGRPETNYEYNESVDISGDGQVQGNECVTCWDRNKNFKNEREEDVNQDGIFNELDCQLYGAAVRHFNNIWLYALACMLLYTVFARYFFRAWQDLAFLAALLFTIHPLHSEAIANVKSRDEIFSLIFISLTFFYSFRYLENKKSLDVFLACLMLLLALLSKEYAVMLLFLVPLSVYFFTQNNISLAGLLRGSGVRQNLLIGLGFVVCAFTMTYIKRDFDMTALPGAKPIRSFWLFPFLFALAGIYFTGVHKMKNFWTLMSWLYFVMLFYIAMRWTAVKLKPGLPDTELLNNPYLLANGEERFCTKTYVLFKYLLLQLFPHPLSSDYSFDSIRYRHFSSWDFIVSLLLHVAILATGVYCTLKKHLLGFAIMLYVLFGLLIANIAMDIGATMGERLIFHSSIGFCIALAYLVLKILHSLTTLSSVLKRFSLMALLILVVILCGIKTWERNFDWKNDVTLFLKDVKTMPNSVLCLGNAGARYVDLLNTRDFTGSKLPGYDTTFNSYNGTLDVIEEEVRAGKYKTRREAGIQHGIEALTHAIELHPRYVNGYLNLGLLYFNIHKDFEALYCWKNVERLYPNNPYLRTYYQAYANDLRNRAALAFNHGRMDSVVVAYNLLTLVEPNNAGVYVRLGGAYYNSGRMAKAANCWQKALVLDPARTDARQYLKSLPPGIVRTP